MCSAKRSLVGNGALLLCSLLSALSGVALAMQDIDLSEADNGKLISVEMGQQASLRLPENPSTGYTWSIETPVGLQVQNSRFLPPPAQMVGTPGQHVWTLKPLEPGDLPVRAKLWREWEGDQSVQRRFEVTLRALRETR